MSGSPLNTHSAFWLALLGLVVTNAWVGWNCWILADQAQAAVRQLTHLKRLERQIEELREHPIQLEEGTRSSDALARLVETAAKQAKINPEQIVRIDPGDPRRIEKTSHLEQKTSVELREIPLRQLVEFSLALEETGAGMHLPSLSLRVPVGTDVQSNTEELWNAQIILTCYVYDGSITNSPTTSLSR
ncbi:hypothetical protein [Schlesneria paludicola]|uniref:hypothetical protein n=1 Tax=Schlesneria paludicola TaxID=360056 RepID=UPI00029B0D4D|nr:hypothetical protein [Schlesneria paludicola]